MFAPTSQQRLVELGMQLYDHLLGIQDKWRSNILKVDSNLIQVFLHIENVFSPSVSGMQPVATISR